MSKTLEGASVRALSIPEDVRALIGARVCSPASVKETGRIVSVGLNPSASGLCYVQWDHAVSGFGPAKCELSSLREIA